jgi:hypothetical protein
MLTPHPVARGRVQVVIILVRSITVHTFDTCFARRPAFRFYGCMHSVLPDSQCKNGNELHEI